MGVERGEMPDIIVADDGDGDEPDPTDRDGALDELDEDELEDAPPEPARPRRRPNYQELQAEVDKLRNATRRNNAELAKRRHVQEFMEQHGIEDFNTWLAEQGIDRQTGQRTAPPESTPAPQPSPADQPAGDANVNRLVELEIEKAQARWDDERTGMQERHDTLTGLVRRLAVEAELAKSQFSGTLDKALRLVEMDKVQIGDDESITGADEAVAALRGEIPEWFRRNGPRPRTGGEDVDGGRKPPRPPARQTWEQRALSQMIPGAGNR